MTTLLSDNYDAFLKAQEFLLINHVTDFPINIEALIKDYGIILSTKSSHEAYRKSINDSRPFKEINDGRTYYKPSTNTYLIIFNETKPNNRIRFTLAHELGHVILGHLNDNRTEIDRGGLSNELYAELEDAADTFAGNLLAPPILVMREIGKGVFDESKVCKSFGLSRAAVQYYRKNDCLSWLQINPTNTERVLLNNFQNKKHPRYCDECGTQVFGETLVFCPICGQKLSKIRGNHYMTYDRIELNDRHKAKICPNCKNEETDVEGKFCQICGKPLVNTCIYRTENFGYNPTIFPCCDAGETLPGNARYCPYCGSETTYLSYGLLEKWENEVDIDESNDLPF